MEKSEYDGSDKKDDNDNKTDGNEIDGNVSSDNAPIQSNNPSRRKEIAPRTGKTRLKADKVARVKLADGTFVNTMEHPLKNLGGILSPELLARLLCLKYDFSMPENRQIRLLTREGIQHKQYHAE